MCLGVKYSILPVISVVAWLAWSASHRQDAFPWNAMAYTTAASFVMPFAFACFGDGVCVDAKVNSGVSKAVDAMWLVYTLAVRVVVAVGTVVIGVVVVAGTAVADAAWSVGAAAHALAMGAVDTAYKAYQAAFAVVDNVFG